MAEKTSEPVAYDVAQAVVHEGRLKDNPAAILAVLQSESADDAQRADAIIHAEAASLDDDQWGRLSPILRNYIQCHRDSNDPTTVIAVGCAVRTYVAGMPMAEFGSIAALLEADDRTGPSLDAQIELTKMAVRKLTANPPLEADSQPELAERLFEVVERCLNPRCLAAEKFGPIALNAVLALMLLRARRTADVLERIDGLSVGWFRGLLSDRAARLQEEIALRLPDDKRAECLQSLHELQSRLSLAAS